jgi:hypothetical protein
MDGITQVGLWHAEQIMRVRIMAPAVQDGRLRNHLHVGSRAPYHPCDGRASLHYGDSPATASAKWRRTCQAARPRRGTVAPARAVKTFYPVLAWRIAPCASRQRRSQDGVLARGAGLPARLAARWLAQARAASSIRCGQSLARISPTLKTTIVQPIELRLLRSVGRRALVVGRIAFGAITGRCPAGNPSEAAVAR